MAITDNSTIKPLAVNDPLCSSDSVWYKDNEFLSVSDKFDEIEAVVANKANAAHTHAGYASSSDLTALEDIVNTKANSSHIHTEYASVNHSHNDYATTTALDTLGEEVDSKADASHTHNEYAEVNHSHVEYSSTSHTHDNYATVTALETLESEIDGKASATHTHNYAAITHTHDDYAPVSHTHTASEIGAAVSGHNHDEDYADINHNHNGVYAVVGHDHNEDYASIEHLHTDYATVSSLNEVSTIVSGKANVSHSHNDIYYTEIEIDTKLANKSDSTHTHIGVYDVNGAAANALTSANAYTDSKIDALVGEGASITLDTIGEISSAIEDNQDAIDLLNAAIGNKANAVDLNAHADNTEIHITDIERNNWNAKSNFSGNYNDLTNKPTIPSISGLATETYVDTQINAIDIPSSLSDLTTDATHRVVTDAEKAAWDAKSNFSGNYNDLTNKPSIPSISGLATETYVDEAIGAKADVGHNHDNVYYTETEIDALLANKANSNHNHNASYDALGTAQTKANEVQSNLDEAIDEFTAHTEDTDIHFTADERSKLSGIASNANNYTLPSAGTNLGGVKSGGDVTISGGLIAVNDDSHNHVISNIDGLQSILDGKAASGHIHDDNYYTETEVDSFLADKADSSHTHTIANVSGLQSALNGKSDSTHNHNSSYDALGAANTALTSAKEYTNDAIADEVTARDSAIATAKSSAISTAASDATTKANNALASAKTYADSAVATVKNDLLNGAGTAYDTLKELGDLIDDNVDAIEALEAVAAGKANASHTHTIANITNLQSTLDGKAATSHGTHVSYSTTAPVMDGSASVGTASTVARSDHKHPTDTSRAAQTSLDSHTGNKSNPHGVTLAQLGLTATAAELNALDGITATVTELNYVDGVTSNIQTQLNGKAASSHAHTIANITNLQTTLDGKAASSHTHKVANISDLTATATELNYVDGVTSNIQTQLDGKAASSHNHAASNITSGTLSSDRLPTVPISKGGTGATTAAGALTNLGITATASELNKLDGVTATTAELNYIDGVTSNIQTQLNGKAASSHTHNILSVQSDNYKQGTDLPSTYPRGETIFFSNNPTNKFNGMSYCTIHTIKGYNNMVCIQFAYPYNTNADTIYYRTALYNTDVWREWKTISVSDHTHNYAGSSSAGGAATSANKLNTNAGDANTPVYFANGVPVACTSLDLNTTGNAATATNVAWSGVTSKPSYYDAKAIKSITRNGTTFTYTCMDGTTGTFTQQDNNTTYGTVTTSANGLMIASDKVKLDGMVFATVSEVETYLGI